MTTPPRDKSGQHRYGHQHQAGRRRWVPRVAAGKVSCWRCGQPIKPGTKWDLGHVDDEDRAVFGVRHPEHRACNRATITHLKERAAKPRDHFDGLTDPDPGNTVTRWSRHWSGGFNPRCPDCRSRRGPCEVAQENEAA